MLIYMFMYICIDIYIYILYSKNANMYVVVVWFAVSSKGCTYMNGSFLNLEYQSLFF